MKNTTRVTIASIFLLTLSASVLAEKSLSYDYVEAGYTHYDVKSSSSDINYNGYTVGGVKEISDNVHVFSSYTDTSTSTTDVDLIVVGAGIHHPLSDNTDVVVNLSRINWDSASTNVSGSGHVNGGDIGVRHHMSDELEITAGIEKYNFSTGVSYKGIGVGIAKKIDENISIVLDHSNLERTDDLWDWDITTISIRHYY